MTKAEEQKPSAGNQPNSANSGNAVSGQGQTSAPQNQKNAAEVEKNGKQVEVSKKGKKDKKTEKKDPSKSLFWQRAGFPWGMVVLGVVCLSLLIGLFFLLGQIPQKARAVQTLRTQVLATQMSDQDRLLLDQALTDTAAERATLKAAFPNEENFLDFIILIDGIKEKIEVRRFSVDSDVPTKVGRNPSFLPMTLVVRGSESDVYGALDTIKNSRFFIKPLTITKSYESEGDQVVLQVRFHLFVADEFVKVNP